MKDIFFAHAQEKRFQTMDERPMCNSIKDNGTKQWYDPKKGGDGADIGLGLAILFLPFQIGAAWSAYKFWDTQRALAVILSLLALTMLVYPIAKIKTSFTADKETKDCVAMPSLLCYNSKTGDFLSEGDGTLGLTVADCGKYFDVILKK